jgi:hypothetical protein
MFEGMFQPMHLLAFLAVVVFGAFILFRIRSK